jgi:hypothetical protein
VAGSGIEPTRWQRWRWAALLVATVVAVAGFWAAGSAESRWSGIGIVSLPLYWLAGYMASWWAAPTPPLALVLGVLLGAEAESNDNEFAWMNYAGGLLLCEAAVIWGALARRAAVRRRGFGTDPERPRTQ